MKPDIRSPAFRETFARARDWQVHFQELTSKSYRKVGDTSSVSLARSTW